MRAIECLEKILDIDPDNEEAKLDLIAQKYCIGL